MGRRIVTAIGGQTRNHIARLDPVTGLADSLDPNANSLVFSFAVQADGKILVGGFSLEQTASVDKPATVSPDSIRSPAWLNLSTRTRTALSGPWRCRPTARYWLAAISTERTASADNRAIELPDSIPQRAQQIRSTQTQTAL